MVTVNHTLGSPPARTWLGASLLVSLLVVLASGTHAYPGVQGPVGGYHAEFTFSPALVGGASPEFAFDSTGHVTIVTTLYDAYGRPLAFMAGSEPARARLIVRMYDVGNATVLGPLFAVDGAVSSPTNVATFLVNRTSLSPGNASASWVMEVVSPNLYAFHSNGLFIGHGGNCMHTAGTSGGALGHGILCAESYYNQASAALFAAGDYDAAAWADGVGTPILARMGGGGTGSIASITILNGDLSVVAGSGPITYLVSAMDAMGNPVAIDSSTQVAWNVSDPAAGSFSQNELMPGAPGDYVVAARLVAAPAIMDDVLLTVTASGSGGGGGGSGGGGGGSGGSGGSGSGGGGVPTSGGGAGSGLDGWLPPIDPGLAPPAKAEDPPVSGGDGDGSPSRSGFTIPWADYDLGFVAAIALFLGASLAIGRGFYLSHPLRWVTVEEILPEPALDARIDLLDEETLLPLRSVYLERLEDEASGGVLWAWQGYFNRRATAQMRVYYHGLDGVLHEAGPAPVEAKIEIPGAEVVRSPPEAAARAPLEVLTV